ncbi:4586_t:CDS:1 [Racocetra fulgida]|uniref:4586_t:CDS:1 n=1 Tax=Racocetra fulgida TaxID=60492 RepID=A0A9N9P3N4_9GLOM|nr:4586_t:CDS:1 [Racocetra fulgida]
MIVATSTHLTITDRASDSNKCPLKVSLIGTPQEKPAAIDNTQNSVIEMLISDYISQDYKYAIYVVFPHDNPRFEHFKTSIQPQESIIFVVGQIEVIDNKFYVSAKDITYININILKKNSDSEHQVQSIPPNSTRSKLLHIHQSITKNSKDAPIIQTSPITISSDIECEPSAKRRRSNQSDQLIDEEFANNNDSKSDQEDPKKPSKKSKSQKNHTPNRTKNKERPIRTTRTKNPHYLDIDNDSNK